jgi:heat shock protein HspQ
MGSSVREVEAMSEVRSKFYVGQLVHHKLFGYRGVVVDVNPRFEGSEEWYEQVARSRPPKDRPWYRVLVHEQEAETYVAERNLEQDDAMTPIEHPLVVEFFDTFEDGVYHRPVN